MSVIVVSADKVGGMNSLDVAHFKEVLGHFATGVAIVTAQTPTGPAGFTCQTFGSLSLEPALVSFAAATAGHSWPKVRDAGVVGVSVLEADQETMARVFATSGIDKFAGIGWQSGPQGAPWLDGAIAHLEGRIVDTVNYGDHDIAVVAVDYVQANAASPLLYYRGGYGLPA